jgi:hypothetical protein
VNLRDIVSHWRLCACDCGRLAGDFANSGCDDQAWAWAYSAGHFAGLVWTYEHDPQYIARYMSDKFTPEGTERDCSDDEVDFMAVVGE